MTYAHALAALVLASLLAPAPAAADEDRATLSTLDGVYASSAPEPWYGGYGTRRFTFGNGRWGLTFVHALDPAMSMKTFQFRTEGGYSIGERSKAVPEAFEAVFLEERKLVTLLTGDAALVEAFGFAGCGLTKDVEVDISETGCAGWKPVAECGEDHDLLALDGDGLRFGVRPADNDMCTPDRRPTTLLMPVVRQ